MDRLFEIVDQALSLPASEREGFLIEACKDDEDLLEEARRLVAADVPNEFMEPPPRSSATHELSPVRGSKLGDFELLEELGRGGMGLVYRARQISLDRIVAVKVLPGVMQDEEVRLERFRRETMAASKLRHPALVSVIASGVEETSAWFAMPLIEGHDLHAEILEQSIGNYSAILLPEFGTPQYATAVAEQLARVAEGIEHAHSQGVIHRDVKPRNILLDRDGQMSLTDFGLAKSSGDLTITESGALQGTPYYMSPEQTHALRDPVGPRSDVYSLSVVLFELLTLRRPFHGEDLQDILSKISSGTPLKLKTLNSRLPRDLCVICETGMAHRPSDRYASAQGLADDLRRFIAGESILARPLPVASQAARWVRRHPWRTLLPLFAATLLVTTYLVGRHARARTMQAEALRPLEALQATSSPEAEHLSGAWRELNRIDSGEVRGLRDHPAVRAARVTVDADIKRRIEAIETAFAAGMGPRFDERFESDVQLAPDPSQLLDGIALASESAGIYP
ncbi:MAG: serine/threonine-protein kinase, partial [Planctomycetota bacterium]